MIIRILRTAWELSSSRDIIICQGLPRWLSGKESTCQYRIRRFNPWVGKMPWRRKWQPTSILAWRIPWTEEPGGLQSRGSQSRTRLKRLVTHERPPKPRCPLKPGLIPSPPASTLQPSWSLPSSCQDARCCSLRSGMPVPHPSPQAIPTHLQVQRARLQIKSSPPYTRRAIKLPFLHHPFQFTH